MISLSLILFILFIEFVCDYDVLIVSLIFKIQTINANTEFRMEKHLNKCIFKNINKQFSYIYMILYAIIGT